MTTEAPAMRISSILTRDDYEQPRSAENMTEWWLSRHRSFGQTKEGVIYCREGKGLSKKFYEEAQPMASLMNAHFSGSSVRCKLLAGTEQADALLLNGSDRNSRRVQITFAVDGHAEHLRRRELTRSGHVDAIAKPTISGSGRFRNVTFPETMAYNRQTLIAELVSQIEDAVAKKTIKGYDSDFVLVVAFNDSIFDADDATAFRMCHRQISHSFSEVYLIGLHGIIVVPEPVNHKVSVQSGRALSWTGVQIG